MAARTERISFGPSVILLPLRNAVGLAHAVATLDRLSGGRLVLGVGTGGNVLGSFEAYNASIHQRGRYCDEALEVMKSLWTGDPVTFSGKLLDLDSYVLGGRPAANPTHPSGSGARRKVSSKGQPGSPTASSPTASAPSYIKTCGRESRSTARPSAGTRPP